MYKESRANGTEHCNHLAQDLARVLVDSERKRSAQNSQTPYLLYFATLVLPPSCFVPLFVWKTSESDRAEVLGEAQAYPDHNWWTHWGSTEAPLLNAAMGTPAERTTGLTEQGEV